MKTPHDKYLERIAQLLVDIEEDAIPHVIAMIEVLAMDHQKKPKLRLVV